MYEHTFEEINHTACLTNYRCKSRNGVDPDVHYTLQLWMIVGGQPALGYQGDDMGATQRYPDVPAYAGRHRFNDGGPEWPGDDRPRWKGYYEHQTLVDPKRPELGVVKGPTPEDVLPNGWADVRAFVDSTIDAMLLFRRRTQLVREVASIRSSFPWQALRSANYLVEPKGWGSRIKVYWGWDFRHYIGTPDQRYVNEDHDGCFDRDEFLGQAPVAWQTLYQTIERINAPYRENGSMVARWNEITELEFEEILEAIRQVKAAR